MQEKFSALIVEDDNINIKLLTVLLEKFCPNIDVVGVAKNTEEFIDLLLSLKPDILLLDIDLGEDKNTLDVLNEVDNLNCEIIITSSHVDFAIKAINEYHVSGYIVKPINSITLTKSVNTAVNSILQKKAWLSKESNNGVSDKILAIPTSTSIEFIETNDIMYLEADGKYTVFYLENNSSKMVSKNIGEYEKHLPKDLFFRIHHKYIVNLNKIKVINKSDGNYCQLKDGKSLSIAKRRQDELRKFLNLK
jgi:two-component system LytT family response regulator